MQKYPPRKVNFVACKLQLPKQKARSVKLLLTINFLQENKR
jgi:hypothetical protein